MRNQSNFNKGLNLRTIDFAVLIEDQLARSIMDFVLVHKVFDKIESSMITKWGQCNNPTHRSQPAC